MSDCVIKVENVSKAYRLGQIGGGTLREDFARWCAKLSGKPDPTLKIGQEHHARKMGEQFWALDKVSFEVKQGEVLGIIGRNGAGKSTLLKILSQVTTPTSGQIKIKGRIASLLEVGTGFHPELTGRENIFLNGAILGMTKAEIRKKFDEIVAFSGVEEFIETPVKRYSSGMYVRLAFAVAAHLEPEILIVDEVLAVGDAEFQKKCIGKMKDVSRGGRTVLFVSHNMSAISALCSDALNMGNGKVLSCGSVDSCIEAYFGSLEVSGSTWERKIHPQNNSPVYFTKGSLEIEGSQPSMLLNVKCQTESVRKHKPAFLAVDILDSTGASIMQAIPTLECLLKDDFVTNSFRISIHLPPMVPGHYSTTLWLGPHNTETYDEITTAMSFDISESPTKGRSFPHSRENGFIVPHSTIAFET
jgi:lipopolysaccharide transport system ATP-binding protein